MENQQQQPGHAHFSSDHHGVPHVCHKCGWPYPNPHPSAKHRRAHKRICGKVEGYKLFDSEGSTHSNVSDDEHLSDDDHNTPVNLAAQGPKVVEGSSNEKGGSGTTELPKRSESEVFSDAAAEFLDGGVGKRDQGQVEVAGELATTKVDKISTAELNATRSIECGLVAEAVKPLGSSPEDVETQHSETPETASDRSVYAPVFAGSAGFKSNTVVSSSSDRRAEGLAALLDGFGNASVDDPIKSETLEEMSRENEKTKTADDVVDGPLKLAGQQTNLEGQNLQNVKMSPSKSEGETAGPISKSDETLKAKPESSLPKPEHDVLQLQEELGDGFHLKTSKSDVSPEVESSEHANSLTDAAEKTVEIFGEVNYVKSRDLVEKKGEVRENVHLLSTSDDIRKVDNYETMLEDFKHHKVTKLDQSASLEGEESKVKGGDAQGPVFEATSQSNQSEGIVVSSSDKHVLEDSVQLDQGSGMRVIKDVLVEGDADMSKLMVETTRKQRSNVRRATEDVVKPKIDKIVSIFSPEGQGSREACSDTSEGKFPRPVSVRDMVVASGKAGSVPETHLVSQSQYEKAEQSDLSGDNSRKEAREVDRAENPVTAAESAISGPDIWVNPATNLHAGDGAGNYLKIESEDKDITANDGAVASLVKGETGVDSRSSPAKEICSEQPVVAPESAKNCSEVGISPETHLASVYRKAEKSDLSGDYNGKEAREVDNAENPVTAAESASSRSEIRVNLASNLQEGGDTGNYVNIYGEKNDIAGNDDAFAAVRPLKNETGVDNRNSHAKESFSEQPVVVREFATTCPMKNETGVDDSNGSTVERFSEQPVVAREFATACPVKNGTGVDNRNNPAQESFLEQPAIAREFATACPMKNEPGVDNINSPAMESFLEQPVVAREFATACPVKNGTGVDNRNSPAEEVFSEQPAIVHEFASAHPVKNETGVDNSSPAKESFSEHPVAAPEFATARLVKTEIGAVNRNSSAKESFSEQPVVAPECAKNRTEAETNSVHDSPEGDNAGSFKKVGTKKVEIMGDSCDVAAPHATDKLRVENSSERPVVISECAKNLAEVKAKSETYLQEGDTAGSFQKVEIKKDKMTGDTSDASTGCVMNNNNIPSTKSCSELLPVTPESTRTLSEVDINLESNAWEGDNAVNFTKVEARRVETTEDAYVAAAQHAKGEAGVDDSNSLSKDILSEHPVVTPESTKNVCDYGTNQETNLWEGDTAGNFVRLGTKKEDKTGDANDGAARHVKDEAAVEKGKSPLVESYSKQAIVTPESARNLSEVEFNLKATLRKGDTVGSFGKVEDKKNGIAEDARDAKDETGVDNNDSLLKDILLVHTVGVPESALSEVEVNPEINLREVDIAGIFDKVETKKVKIAGDDCDIADRHAKDESAVDHLKLPSMESCLEQPVVTSESAKNVSEVQINPETNLGEGDAAGNFSKAEAKKADINGDARDAAACHAEDRTGVDNNINPSKEVFSENPVVTPESAKTLAEVKFNLETDLWEGDAAGSFNKVDTKKENVDGDTCDVNACHVKDELGVDSSVGPTKTSSIEHPLVTLESATNLSDLEVYPETKEKDTAYKFEKVETKKENITGDSCAATAVHVEDKSGVDNLVGPMKESGSENAAVSPESAANQHSELDVNPAINLQEGNGMFDPQKEKIEKRVEHGTESKESSVEENPLMQLKFTPESAIHPREFQTAADDVASALDSSRSVDDVVREIQIETIDHQFDKNGKVQVGKEPMLSPSDAKSSNQSSAAVEGSLAGEFDAASGLGSESFQRGFDRQQFGDCTNGLSIDSSSQTDSLENNWGSVSVVSVQSDAQAITDADTAVPIESQVVTEEKANSRESKPASERQHPDKSEMFEPPSFVTLVEPGRENEQKGNASEMPTGQNSQQAKSSNLQAGWFPSITKVVNESEGRKKNEEIIAKVTNWSTSKPHSPLKNLLGDASLDTRAKSPKRKDQAPSPQKDDKEASAVNPIPAPESSLDQATGREIGNEWNSPARYPAEIKREKRKPKGRPYWAQFMCCSSVH